MRCHADKHLFADDLSLVLVDEFEQRDNHGEAEAADQDVENAGNVAQSERALRRTAALNSMRSSRGNSTAASPPTKHHRCPPAPDPDILKRRGGEDNVSAPSSISANAYNELYTFYTGKGGLLQKNL